MKSKRRTKIIATLGPATDSMEMTTKIIEAGVDLVRLNFSHGEHAEHEKRIQQVREAATMAQREIGILADLQGPKIRISHFKNDKVILTEGHEFILNTTLGEKEGDVSQVGITYESLTTDVHPGDTLSLDDGRIILTVTEVTATKVIATVTVGGELSNNKGINRKGGGLSAVALTTKDEKDLAAAIKMGIDYIAVSFVRNANDIEQARQLIQKANGDASIIAKIERCEAIDNIDEIIAAADAVMVARGDLGVEIGDEAVPGKQKNIIRRARDLDKAVITATQMMESMIHATIPTRAEVSDVANAILDGTDAVMLSAETAVGAHPDKVIKAMSRICLGAEQHPVTQTSKHRLERTFNSVDEAIAMATMYSANHLNIKAIISLTESGATPLWMSRIRSRIPIYALSRNIDSQRRMTLFRGVYPIPFDPTQYAHNEVNRKACEHLEKLNLVQSGDLIIITKGFYMGTRGGTNTMKIVEVGNVQ